MDAPRPSRTADPGPGRGLRCPACGAPASPDSAAAFRACAHCRATLWFDLSRLLRHTVLRPRLGPGEARGALDRAFRAAEVDALVRAAPPRLELHPWYAIRQGTGASMVQASAESAFTVPPGRAADAGDAASADLDELRDARIVAPELTLEEAVACVEGGVPDGARLLHLPSWRIDFEADGRRYTAHVDAVEGEVAAATIPPASTRRLDAAAAVWMTGATLLFAAESALLPGFWLPVAAMGATGAGFYFLVRSSERGRR